MRLGPSQTLITRVGVTRIVLTPSMPASSSGSALAGPRLQVPPPPPPQNPRGDAASAGDAPTPRSRVDPLVHTRGGEDAIGHFMMESVNFANMERTLDFGKYT